MSTVWLGLTLGCTECHNHPYDPFTQKEFYRLGAFFADVQENAVGRQPETPITTPQQEAKLKDFDVRIGQAAKALQSAKADKSDAKVDLKALEAAITKAQKEKDAFRKSLPQTLITTSTTPRTIRVLPRGNWLDDKGEIVGPGTPASLPPLRLAGKTPTRLDLAKWLVAPENPLAARVFANRMWMQTFGHGFTRPLDDLGSRRERLPSHPELLDWLAVEFGSHWDVKKLLETIVTSAAYRQSSQVPAELLEMRDPGQPPVRPHQGRSPLLDAELVRDNALAVSGLLSEKIGGPSVKPYQPEGYWRYLNFPTRTWVADKGDSQYRRGLYTYWQRTFLHPSLQAFDAPSREECTVERPRSNTPMQALVLLNDPTLRRGARRGPSPRSCSRPRGTRHGFSAPSD